MIIITAVSANGCNSAVTKTGKRERGGGKNQMTGAKDGDRAPLVDDRVHVRIKKFSQKEGGALENCTVYPDCHY